MSGMTEPSPARCEIAGIEIELRSLGAGRDLLYLHPGHGLRDHAAFLEMLAADFHVSAPSHPGFEGSALPKNFTTVDDLAYFYLDFLEQRRLREVVLVGASFGAWIAAEIAIKSRAALAQLVLIAPLGARFAEAPDQREIFDLFSYPAYEQDRYLFAEPLLRERNYRDLPQSELVAMARNYESFAMYAWSPTMFDPKLRQRLARLDLPALVLCGESDRVTPLAYSRNFASHIAGAAFEVIPESGHYPQIEQPGAVASRIRRFAAA
jgi:pimeloyl-ACP methyl ester carboxylesterase